MSFHNFRGHHRNTHRQSDFISGKLRNKNLLTGCSQFLLLLALADLHAAVAPYHPYRIIGTNHYDLTPLYRWHTNHALYKTAPMEDWIHAANGDYFIVKQVWEPGLLYVDFSRWDSSGQRQNFPIVITNYPGWSKVKDGDRLDLFAFEIGRYQWREFSGSTHTVPLYDYGIPYDPWQLNTQHALTNKLRITLIKETGNKTATTNATPKNK